MIAVTQVDGKDKIIAGSIWNAPGKRIQFSLKEMIPLYRAGTLTVLRYWGFSGVKASPTSFLTAHSSYFFVQRMIDYFPKAEAVFEEEWRRRNGMQTL